MGHVLSRIAIVNRGEPALRLMRAARDFAATRNIDIETIAFYTEPDAKSLYLRRAQSSYLLGPSRSYLDYARLRTALIETKATAAWVGWGFVAEHPEFAALCDELGITFIGPTAAAMRALGDKISSKRLAEEAKVPVSAWTGGPVKSTAEARAWAEKHGVPLMVKATAGGGGRGVRRVDALSELDAAFTAATNEAQKAFGNGDCYLERLIENARHVEVQIAADTHGNVWAVGLRDCTLQRKHQKVVEEAPPATVSPALLKEMSEAAKRLAVRAGYRSLGTVEYLFEPDTGRYYFMEMNARIQVEHPVTEQTTGIDLVGLQLGIAMGDKLEGEEPKTTGHAIEVRFCVEDPARAFAPAPGRLALVEWPMGPGVRVDAGYAENETVPDAFDSMIAKIIATGATREQARIRLLRALDETQVVVEGGATNRSFLSALLRQPDVINNVLDVRWIDRMPLEKFSEAPRVPELALCFAAIEAFKEQRAQQLGRFAVSARRGRLELGESDAAELGFSLLGQSHTLLVVESGPKRYQVKIGDAAFALEVETHSAQHRVARLAGHSVPYVVFRDEGAWLVEVAGETHRIGSASANQVQAPGPGLVQSVAVAEGDVIAAGDTVCVLEAMKTETAVRAPRAGRIKRVLVAAGMQVKAGASLAEIEAEGTQNVVAAPSFASSAYASKPTASLADWLRGYDSLAKPEFPSVSPLELLEALESEHRLLELYVPAVTLDDGSEREITADFALLSYVARGSIEAAKLSAAFGTRLAEAAAAYGDEEKIAAVARMERAIERLPRAATVLAKLLDGLGTPEPALRDRLRVALEGTMNLGTERAFELADAAHRAWFNEVERPLVDMARGRQDGRVRERLRMLLENPPEKWSPDELQRIADTPELLLGLTTRFGAEANGPRLVLDLFLRRFYGAVHPITPIVHAPGQAETRFGGERVVAICVKDTDALAVFERVAQPDIYVDLIVLAKTADVMEQTKQKLEQTKARCKRVTVIGASAEQGKLFGYRTYEWREDGLQRRDLYRDIHPMMTERFELSRLSRFETKRVPAPEDIFLVSAEAKENEKDQRLFGYVHFRGGLDLAEFRTRLQTQLREAALTMRRAVATRTKVPLWNRLVVYVAQPFMHDTEIFAQILSELAPVFRPLNLERVSFRVRLPEGEPSTRSARGEPSPALASTSGRQPTLLDRSFTFDFDGKGFVAPRISEPSREPLRPLSRYVQKVLQLRRRGLNYAYDVIARLAGDFAEHDLAPDLTTLVPVTRAPGENTCAMVVGIISNVTEKHPEGMRRVLLVGDASLDMGSLAEPECRRVIAAIALAEKLQLPLEWFPVSSGAAISMQSGTENLDWTARVLRKIIEHTQQGGEINLVVDAINVGAQSYWNAEATMLMHTRGALIMTKNGAMVLTGKKALEFSGGVSAADHQGIGGLERIMGPNGEAQYAAKDLPDAIRLLFRYYEHTYVAPGEKVPRARVSQDASDRDMAKAPYPSAEFQNVGEVFSDASNPGRKRAFDIRAVMRALVDTDDQPLERFAPMRDAESAVVWDAHVGGVAVSVIGIESKQIERRGFVPADGPERFSGGTLFPLSSKKVARALNAASGKRPVVVLANLSGFDGSPESLRRLQLEYGAEIGRAIVNFKGPIIFSVLSRYHGGAYVVFSKTLNDGLHASALEGAYASVIGGAPAAAVVFTQEVRRRVAADPRAKDASKAVLQAVEREKIQGLAEEFDRTHDINRAKRVGSIDDIVSINHLRAAVISRVTVA